MFIAALELKGSCFEVERPLGRRAIKQIEQNCASHAAEEAALRCLLPQAASLAAATAPANLPERFGEQKTSGTQPFKCAIRSGTGGCE